MGDPKLDPMTFGAWSMGHFGPLAYPGGLGGARQHAWSWQTGRTPKDGTRYNANAGPTRNAEMVAAGAEMCIAFHRRLAWSRGTKDCVRRAIAAEIPTYLIDSEQARPRRLRAGDARLRWR
jgi:hypothetical protein